MEELTIYDIVYRVVGKINPVGESHTDERRLENLRAMTELVDKLITDIDRVGMLKNDQRYSMKTAGEFADKFLTSLGIEE